MTTTRYPVLGIDPGIANCGWGVVSMRRDGTLCRHDSGVIITSPRIDPGKRLLEIYEAIEGCIHNTRTFRGGYAVAMEGLRFSSRNRSSALQVAEVMGVIKLLVARYGREVAIYAPAQVKRAVGAGGRADKEQVKHMVGVLLGWDASAHSHHEADALAVAIAHLVSMSAEKR